MLRFMMMFIAAASLLISSNQTSFSQENVDADASKQKIPVSYIENRGQWSPEVKYMAQLRGMNVWFTDKGLKYDVYTSRPATSAEIKQEKARLSRINREAAEKLVSGKPMRRSGQVIEMELVGASKLAVTGMEQQTSYRNYFIGRDKAKWQTGVPVFSKLRSEEVYPGIDVVYSFQDGKPRYDFVVKPGANPSSIALRFNGANSVSVSADKGITLSTKLGDMYNGNIYAYQTINGREMQVPCEFTKQGEEVKFTVGNYDKNAPLVIDPLVYSTYFGGSGNDEINGIALDNLGNVVVAGGTSSPNFPYTKGAYDTTENSGTDAFIAKFDKSTTTLLYSTFIGGGSDEKANAVALDGSNNIFICGVTNSSNLPTSGWKTDYAGLTDAFIAMVSANGKTLNYCTYAGGKSDDQALAIAINPKGEACVAGETNSNNFPTVNAYKRNYIGLYDAFILKLKASGANVSFSTYFGGSGNDRAYAVGCDQTGNYIYAAGVTGTGFGLNGTYPSGWQSPYNNTFNATGNFTDGWVAKMSDETGIFSDMNNHYITYIGANKNDEVRALTVLKDGSCIVTGQTQGGPGVKNNFPTNASNTVNKGGYDVFVSKLKYDGTELLASTMFGGSGDECGVGISVSSSSSEIFVAGQTTSQDFQMSELSPPLLPAQANLKGAKDAFLARVPIGLEKVGYATYFGGRNDEGATSVVATARGDAYIAGNTNSDNLTVIENEYQSAIGGGQDGFISKVAFGAVNLITPNGGTYCPGSALEIRWTKTDGLTDADAIEIELSSNAGETWYKKITPNPVQGLNYTWNIPTDQQAGTKYKVRLIHASGIQTENIEPFVIGTSVQITENPVGDSVCPGAKVSFHVAGSGSDLKYKWYYENTPIPGATSDTYVIPSAQTNHAGRYKVDVSAGCIPATSQTAYLYVRPVPKVTVQPVSDSVSIGGSHTFKIVATGKYLTYEWYKDGVKIQGANNREYTITSANGGSKGKYWVIVRGECGADTSREALLTIDTTAKGVNEQPMTQKDVHLSILSPQPSSDELTAAVTSINGCALGITLIDNLGRNVMNVFNGTIDAGISRNISVDVKNLPSGIYWLSAKCGGENSVQKVEILH